MSQISSMSEVTDVAVDDLFEIVDVSEDSSKKVKHSTLRRGDIYGGPPIESGGTRYSVPGVQIHQGALSTYAMLANTINYFPFHVNVPMTVDAILLLVAGTPTAVNARVGVYKADSEWQPTTLVLDAGLVGTGTTGLKTASFTAQKLPCGRYLTAVINDQDGTFSSFRGGVPTGDFRGWLSNPFLMKLYRAATVGTGALPSNGYLWDTFGSPNSAIGGGHMHVPIFRVTGVDA